MAQLLVWFAAYLVASLITRLFVGITFIYISSTLIYNLIDQVNAYLSQFQFYQVLLLAGFGKFLSIMTAAFIFKTSYLYLARKSS